MLTHIHPSRLQFTCRTRPIFNGAVIPAQSPGPPKARQAPRAPLPVRGVTSYDAASRTPSEGATPPSSLIRAHAPDQIPPTVFGSPSYRGSLQVVVSPCWKMALPGVISANLSPDAWSPTPVLPLVLTPVPSQGTSAFAAWGAARQQTTTRTATSVRRAFRGCRQSIIFKPLGLLAIPVAPTAVGLSIHWAAMAFTSEHIAVCYLPAHRIC